jgi:hypothetical protein
MTYTLLLIPRKQQGVAYCEIYPSAALNEKWFAQRTYGTFPPPFSLRLAEEQISL